MKTKSPLDYHHNVFVITRALGHMMYCSILLVPVKRRVLNNLGKKRNISSHKWSKTHTECSNLTEAFFEHPLVYGSLEPKGVTVQHVPKFMSCYNAIVKGILFSWLHIYYAHLASARLEHSMCLGSLIIYLQTRVSSFPGLISVAWVNE